MAHSATVVYIVLVPGLFLPHGEVTRMIDTRPVKLFELLWRNTRCCHYYRHCEMLENVFTLCFTLGQTRFSALDSQPVLILPHAADLPNSSLKELKKKGEESPTKQDIQGNNKHLSPCPCIPVPGPFSLRETRAVLTWRGNGEPSG